MKKENSPRSTERTPRRGSVLHIVKEHNNQTKRNKAVHKRRANELRAEVEAVKQGKATSLAPVPKAKKNKTMNNILKNLSAPTTKSKALQNRLTRRRGIVKAFEWSPNPFDIYEPVEYETAAAVAVEAAEAAEAASATAQQAAVVATQGTPVKGRYTSNLATINFSAQEQPRPNVGQHFNEFQANNWVRRGRVADLGHNFNVFGYEPVNEKSKLEHFFSAPPKPAEAVAKPDPLALLPNNWNMYTNESKNRRAANAKNEIARKKQENIDRRHEALMRLHRRQG